MSDDRLHEPVCGEHFCDRCGDCLSCYGGEDCYDGGDNNGPHTFEDPDNDTKAIPWTEAFKKGIVDHG